MNEFIDHPQFKRFSVEVPVEFLPNKYMQAPLTPFFDNKREAEKAKKHLLEAFPKARVTAYTGEL